MTYSIGVIYKARKCGYNQAHEQSKNCSLSPMNLCLDPICSVAAIHLERAVCGDILYQTV